MPALALLDTSIASIDQEIISMHAEIERLKQSINERTIQRNNLEIEAESIELSRLEHASLEEKTAYYLDYSRGVSPSRYNRGSSFLSKNFGLSYSQANEDVKQMKLLVQLFPEDFDCNDRFITHLEQISASVARIEPFLNRDENDFACMELIYSYDTYCDMLISSDLVRIIVANQHVYEGASLQEALMPMHTQKTREREVDFFLTNKII